MQEGVFPHPEQTVFVSVRFVLSSSPSICVEHMGNQQSQRLRTDNVPQPTQKAPGVGVGDARPCVTSVVC